MFLMNVFTPGCGGQSKMLAIKCLPLLLPTDCLETGFLMDWKLTGLSSPAAHYIIEASQSKNADTELKQRPGKNAYYLA